MCVDFGMIFTWILINIKKYNIKIEKLKYFRKITGLPEKK
jgi:hypothetical protein